MPPCFEILASLGPARTGRLATGHGTVDTPAFMPVGTQATVKTLHPDEVARAGYGLLLCNTYHLMLRPGAETVARLGGLHAFMGWKGAILTDSGGYQVLSLAGRRRVDDDGVTFKSHVDGSSHRLTPERALEIQALLGSDIAMVLDVCPRSDAPDREIRRAMERTTRWAERSLALERPTGQLLFGIVQGGVRLDWRDEHLAAIASLGFDGIALGGLAVGEPPAVLHDVVRAVAPSMPANKPRYLMGVGTPIDLVEAVRAGIDLFDCVLPTRDARHGVAFTSRGKVAVKRARHAVDRAPLDPACACPTCGRFSVGYLRHLFAAGEMLAARLLTEHNLFFYAALMRDLRGAIREGETALASIAARVRDAYGVAVPTAGTAGPPGSAGIEG